MLAQESFKAGSAHMLYFTCRHLLADHLVTLDQIEKERPEKRPFPSFCNVMMAPWIHLGKRELFDMASIFAHRE